MSLVERLKHKLGIAGAHSGRHPIRIFLLEDDERRCEWFAKRFKGDLIDVACDVPQARELKPCTGPGIPCGPVAPTGP